MISFSCECGKQFRLKDEFAGRRATCSCGRSLTVPQNQATSPATATSKDTASRGPASKPQAATVAKPQANRPVKNLHLWMNPEGKGYTLIGIGDGHFFAGRSSKKKLSELVGSLNSGVSPVQLFKEYGDLVPLDQVTEVKRSCTNLEQSTEFSFLLTHVRSVTTFAPPKPLISIKCAGKPAIGMMLGGSGAESNEIVDAFQAAVGPDYDRVDLPIENAWQALQHQILTGIVLVAVWGVIFYLTINYAHLRETNALERNNGVTKVVAWINEHIGTGNLLLIGVGIAAFLGLWSTVSLVRRKKSEGLRKR